MLVDILATSTVPLDRVQDVLSESKLTTSVSVKGSRMKSGSGTCPHCEKRVRLRDDGTMYKHDLTDEWHTEPCPGGIFSFPKREAPVDPHYCETCMYGDCFDCEDTECMCQHWCPTRLQITDLLKPCPVCQTPIRINKKGQFDYHSTLGNNYVSCQGSNRPYLG